jgi:hypothetical protein
MKKHKPKRERQHEQQIPPKEREKRFDALLKAMIKTPSKASGTKPK